MNEPLSITHVLTICLGELSKVAEKLYEKGEENAGNEVEDANILLEQAMKYCREKRL